MRELVFPLAGQFGLGKFFHAQAAQQRHQLEGLGRRYQLTAFTKHVFFGKQALDDGRSGGGRAQAFFLHGLAQFVVFDSFAGALHGAQQRRLRVACGWPGLQALGLNAGGAHLLTGLHRHQALALVAVLGVSHLQRSLFAVNRQPAGLDQHLALGLEAVACGGADAGGHLVLGAREKHRHEAAHHQVIDFLLGLTQPTGGLQRGDDGEVVTYLGVVKHPLGRLDVVAVERGQGMRGQVPHA